MSEHTHHEFGSHDTTHDHHDVHTHGHVGHDGTELGTGAYLAAHTAVHGDPAQAAPYWFVQHGDNDCMLASVTQVVSEAVGHPIPESEVLQHMHQLGIELGPHGLEMEQGLRVLQSFNIASHEQEGANVQQLEKYLDQGRSVILGVDGPAIWNALHGTHQHDGGHAVVLTAIDPVHNTVTLSDTGIQDGNEETVPLNVFEYAWATMGHPLIVTDVTIHGHPGPALLPLTLQPHHQDVPAPTHTAPALHSDTPAGPVQPAHHTPEGPVQPAHHSSTPPAPGTSYTVQPGDTLWNIAEHAYGHGTAFKVLAQANGITNPDQIRPGQVLAIPAQAQ